MLPALASLISLQQLDTAADTARKRLADLPAAEQAIETRIAAATAAVESAKARLAANQTSRRTLEKDVAATDARLARFDDHKAAVKTNQEYTALLHEISGAKAEKDALEEKILILLEEADTIAAEVKAAEAPLAALVRDTAKDRAAIAAERQALEAELTRLAAERQTAAASTDPRTLATYEQLLKGRRGVAVSKMTGELCTACHVRLRPHVTQQVRRNDAIVQCESCQRILYFDPPAPQPAP